MKSPLHIIHLEDDEMDASMVEVILETEKIPAKITVVCTKHEFQGALTRDDIDLILSDFSMPRFDGLSALEIARKHRPEIPFIFVSGTIGEELAVQALREGATDYVLKDRMGRLPAAIRRAMADAEATRERIRAEEQLRHQAALLDLAQDAICLNDMNQSILYWNKSAERLYGWTAQEAMGRNANELLFQDDLAAPVAALKNLIRVGKWEGELQQVSKDEKRIIVESRWTLMRDEKGEPKSILIINTDITEKKQFEAQLLRTQRVESIGALAGGIAHDLNNSLTPVLMAFSVLRDHVIDLEHKKLLAIAQTSAQHSVDMVKQILSFSRGVGGRHAPLQVPALVNDIIRLAKDTLPRSIQIQSNIASDLWTINGNSTQLHQVLLNLCVNARDAMPNGGSLIIEASNRVLEEAVTRPHSQPPGPYVLIAATDTGHGISADVLAKIFEPFFTTKEIGKGTGLGLSTVMGIVKTHGGFVEVASEVGKGTSFKIFLPALHSSK